MVQHHIHRRLIPRHIHHVRPSTARTPAIKRAAKQQIK
jgi:hypothetical protein